VKQLVAVGLVLGCCSIASATETFTYPPETHYYPGSGREWVTTYPDYQRNTFLDFSVDPHTEAPTGNGVPGAVYYGTDDEALKASDHVQFFGDIQWYHTVPGQTRTGLVGIDNRDGTENKAGYLRQQLDNWSNGNPEKHAWLEGVFGFTTENVVLLWFDAPDPHVVDWGWGDSEDLGVEDPVAWGTGAAWVLIEPNPPYEEIFVGSRESLGMFVPPGHAFLVDEMHLATECVPEPGTLALVSLGALALLGCAGRKRRR